MKNIITEILESDHKHKQKVALITEKTKNKKEYIEQLFEIFQSGTDVERGTMAEVLKFVSNDNPDILIPYINIIIEYIDHKAPRVKWGCPEALGNIARKYPYKVEKAIPKLFKNLDNKSIVVRWCASYALTEIAKYNYNKQNELIDKFQEIIQLEENNGVKNLYIKAIKEIEKQKKDNI